MMGGGGSESIVQKVERLEQENERLRRILQSIAEGDVPRKTGKQWRSDGQYSKNDKCEHNMFMYEECAECVYDFAREKLKEIK